MHFCNEANDEHKLANGFRQINRIALVFPISLAIGGTVFQDLVSWTKDAIIIFVINVFVFLEKPALVIGRLYGTDGTLWLSMICFIIHGV